MPPADDTPTAAAVAQRLWAFQAGASTTPVPAFLFHHLPKTGGSKVDGILKQHWRRVLGQNFSCHGQGLPAGGIPACEIQPFDPRSRCRATCSNYHTPPSEFPRPCDATAADSGLEVVTLLRHPYDRAISEYHMKCHQPPIPGRSDVAWTRPPASPRLRSLVGRRLDDPGHETCPSGVATGRGVRPTWCHGRSSCLDDVGRLNRWLQAAIAAHHDAFEPAWVGKDMGSDCHLLPQARQVRRTGGGAIRYFCSAGRLASYLASHGVATPGLHELPRYDARRLLSNETLALVHSVYADDFRLCSSFVRLPAGLKF